jgi:hypothetical protein
VIFQIGLLPNARGRQLTAGEIDDAVYCLRKLEELEQSGGRVVFPTEHA